MITASTAVVYETGTGYAVSGTVTVAGTGGTAVTTASCAGKTQTFAGDGAFKYGLACDSGQVVVQLVSTAAGKVSRLTKTATAGDLGSHRTTAVLSGPALTDAGEAVLATDADLVRSDLYLLLSTGKTERVMRPHMGSMLSSLVYSVADASTLKDEISAEISRLLAASNLGVTLLSCAVAVDERTVLVTLQLARPGIPQFDLALNYARL